MKNKYYIISDTETERMIITKNYSEIYDFIVSNLNSKIRTIGIDLKPRILDRRVFLHSYFKNTTNNNKFYELVKILIKYDYDRSKFLKPLKIYNEYKFYMNNKNNLL